MAVINGQTYYNNGLNGTQKETYGSDTQRENQSYQKILGDLAANPLNRNMTSNPFALFTQGSISLEQARKMYNDTLASNPYDPSKGPQINTGNGFQSISNFKTNPGIGNGFSGTANGQNINFNGQGNSTNTGSVPSPYVPNPGQTQGSRVYTVQSGDTLNNIAASHGLTTSQLYALNPQFRSPTPGSGLTDLIHPGQTVNLGQMSPATAPSNAGAVVKGSSVSIPPSQPMPTGDVTSATASVAGVNSNISTLEQQRADQIKSEQDALTAADKPFLDKWLQSGTVDQAKANAIAQTGMDPATYFADQKAKIAEIESLTTDYNKLLAAKTEAENNVNGQMATQGYISRAQAEIDRRYAPQLNQMSADINAKTATLHALQQNFSEAQTFIDKAVSDAIAMEKYNYDVYTEFAKVNADAMAAMDAPYKAAFDLAMKQAETQLTQKTADTKAVGDMMLANPKAGISITDSLATAYQKVQAVGGYASLAEKKLAEGGGNGSTSGTFTSSQQNSGAAALGVDLNTFNNYSYQTKDYLVKYGSGVQQLLSAINNLGGVDKSGNTITTSSLTAAINNSTAPDELKQVLLSKIPNQTTSSSGGFWSGVGNWIKGLFA